MLRFLWWRGESKTEADCWLSCASELEKRPMALSRSWISYFPERSVRRLLSYNDARSSAKMTESQCPWTRCKKTKRSDSNVWTSSGRGFFESFHGSRIQESAGSEEGRLLTVQIFYECLRLFYYFKSVTMTRSKVEAPKSDPSRPCTRNSGRVSLSSTA